MQLNLTNISYTYPGAVSPAVRDVGVTFSSGWTAVIGDNGCGKSTLARIATRLIEPDSGTVGSKLFSVYCQQDSSLEPGNLIDFASDWNQEAQRAKALLHIGDDWPWRYDTLSGGQQKRLQIACALYARPDVLVMDEPTNDLDAPTREIVSEALAHSMESASSSPMTGNCSMASSIRASCATAHAGSCARAVIRRRAIRRQANVPPRCATERRLCAK